MLPSVVLDAVSFWLYEEQNADEDSATIAVENALSWLKPGGTFCFDLLVSQASISKLEELGMFPAEPYFTRILQAADLAHIVTPRQLAAYVARFLASTEAFEDSQPIIHALFDDIAVDPELNSNVRNPILKEVSSELLGLTALNNSESQRLMYAYSSLLTNIETVQVQVRASIIEFKGEEKQIEQPVLSSVSILTRPDDFSSRLSSSALWENAEGISEIHLSIVLEAQRLSSISGKPMRPFEVGASFFASLRACEASEKREFASVVRARCAQLIASSDTVEINDFHTSTKRTAVRYRASDNACAKRVHITKSHEALRLMFWLRNDGIIELANIGNKMDKEIVD